LGVFLDSTNELPNLFTTENQRKHQQ